MLIKGCWILSLYVLLLIGCTSKDIPQEGEIVTWKQDPKLIVKAKLGPRREHIPDRFDSEFYKPEREHYLGQFPIDYVPEKFPLLTREEVNSLPMPDSNRQLQFNLMLNGSKVQSTDRTLVSEQTLEHTDQVKVEITGQGLNFNPNYRTKEGYEKFLEEKKGNYNAQYSAELGMDCYIPKHNNGKLYCFGESENKQISGVAITLITEEVILGHSWEPIHGGINVQWRIHKSNLKRWKEVDAAIWRLVDIWNVSPLASNNS